MKEVIVKEKKYLLSARELAKVFNTSERCIQKWTARGVIDYVKGIESAGKGKLYDLGHTIHAWKEYLTHSEEFTHMKEGRAQGIPLDIIEVVAEYDLPLDDDHPDDYD